MQIFDTPPTISSPTAKFARVAGVLVLVVLLAACGNGNEPPATPDPTAIPTTPPTEEPAPVEDSSGVEETADETEEDSSLPSNFPPFDYSDLSVLDSYAANTPHGTFELYLRDAITQQVSFQRQKIDMRTRYQEPEVMLQDLGGLIVNIEMVEDRSELIALRPTVDNPTSAEYSVEIDIRITYGDLDTSSQACAWVVNLQRGVNGKWYVVNPQELLIFVNCAPR